MNSQQDEQQKVVWVVLVGVILLAISLALGFGISRSRSKAAPVAPVAATAEATDGASVRVENGVVKFYFASGKAELAVGAHEALVEVVKAVAAGKKAVISGFHDATGDPAANAELARQRALAVQDALTALGADAQRIDLKKPEQLEGTGSLAEARRVEVVVE